LIICDNCNQLEPLARDCLNPCTTCTYCRELDHVIKYCNQILAKCKERGNQNENLNQNVQKISDEKCNEGPRIVVVMCGGTRIVDYAINGRKQDEQWVNKYAGPIPKFDAQPEKETYRRERKQILGLDWATSKSSMPHVCDCTMREKTLGKLSNLRELHRSSI